MLIYKSGSKWKIENVKATYDTREKAIKALQAIKASQMIKGVKKHGNK